MELCPQEIYRSVDVYIRSSENLCAGIMQLSETMVNGMGKMVVVIP